MHGGQSNAGTRKLLLSRRFCARHAWGTSVPVLMTCSWRTMVLLPATSRRSSPWVWTPVSATGVTREPSLQVIPTLQCRLLGIRGLFSSLCLCLWPAGPGRTTATAFLSFLNRLLFPLHTFLTRKGFGFIIHIHQYDDVLALFEENLH